MSETRSNFRKLTPLPVLGERRGEGPRLNLNDAQITKLPLTQPLPEYRERSKKFALLACLLIAGCKDFGAGGTGELTIPHETLHRIDTLNLPTAPVPPPSTQPTTAATLPTTLPATQPVREVQLSIEEARRLALQNNLDLKVQFFDPKIAGDSLDAERAKFEWVFRTTANYSRSDQQTGSELTSPQFESFQFQPGIDVPLTTGGTLSLSVPMERDDSNGQFNTLNPVYTSSGAIQFSQPLLRGFGTDVTAQSIRLAFYASQQSQARTKLEVIRVLADTERAYWRLFAARRLLEVRQKEYDLANAQLDRARRFVRGGTQAEVEITRAESGVADTLDAIITAENAVRTQQRDLKRLINDPALGLDTPTAIVPSTTPEAMVYKVDPTQLVRDAMNGRMELLETELQIAAESANVAAAENATLPLVTMQYQYADTGLSDHFDNTFTTIREKRYENHTAGITLEIPLGNAAARANLRAAMARRLQQLATKTQQELQITQDIYNAVDTLELSLEKIKSAKVRVTLNQRLLEVEIRQFNNGLRTSTDVLDAQAKLADAAASLISAITDYQISQVDLAFATGTTLGASRIDWQATGN
jgi:outer membrane protein